MIDVKIVLGLGFGDEGKGSVVNSLCDQNDDSLVIRFNAGHQVGHTVVTEKGRHVFSNFGSGTLKGQSTYWSEYCTIDPIGYVNEYRGLLKLGLEKLPNIYYNAEAMVTTPYDKNANIIDRLNIKHGSVGVGFGKTIKRNEDNYHLYYRDLYYPEILDEKLRLIGKEYYGYSEDELKKLKPMVDRFKSACNHLINQSSMVYSLNDIEGLFNVLIFEGAQGIMLDKDYGFFPNVTRSNTTSKNAMDIIKRLERKCFINTYYVTRAYQTRHGNGHMTNSDMNIEYIIENPNETNVNGGYQGMFRKSVLDLGLIEYAITCDEYHNTDSNKSIVVTCLDQVPEKFPMTIDGNLITGDADDIGLYLGISNVLTSYSEKGIINKDEN
jgi:adenylosuccinate synthase